MQDDHPDLEPDRYEHSDPRSEELFADRYSIIHTIGAGGMGKVFEAFDTRIGRTVALKLMRARARDKPSLVHRFHREYRAMARLHHPGVPRVHDAGSDENGRTYYTMEIVRGESLVSGAHMDLKPHQKLALIRNVAEMLIQVHEAGIIHRDIKPSNILVDGAGRPHLIDFGACSLADETASEGPIAPATHIRTAPGTWLGTLGYIDPSILEGATCSARSDIYSLTATLAWLFTQEHPSADSRGGVPRTGIEVVDALLRRGMARDPEERPVTAAHFAAELAAAELALSESHRTILRAPAAADHLPSRSFSPALVLALGVLGGALAGVIQSAAVTEGAPARPRAQPIPLERPWHETVVHLDPVQITSDPGDLSSEPNEPRPQLLAEADAVDRQPEQPQRTTKPVKSPGRARVAALRRTITPEHIEQEIRPHLEGCLKDVKDASLSPRITVKVVGSEGSLKRSIGPNAPDRAMRACFAGRLERFSFQGFSTPSEFSLTLRPPRRAHEPDPN